MATQPIAGKLYHRLLRTTSLPSSPSADQSRSLVSPLPRVDTPAMSIPHRNSIVARSLLRDLLSRGPVPVPVNRKLKAANSDSNPPVGSGKEGEDREKEKREGRLHIPQPPEMPKPGDCCGSGCVRCVWDVYQDELKAYEDICGSSGSDDHTNRSKS